MTDYLILFAIVLGINLLPAFGPPTWSVIAFYGLTTGLPLHLLVPTAALAAALGRFLLGSAFRYGGKWLSKERRESLAAVRTEIGRRRRSMLLGLGLFVLSPFPSAQLFEAAGLARIPLAPFTAAFFIGRLGTYFLYASAARAAQATSLGDDILRHLTNPAAIALEIATILLLVLFIRIDWRKLLHRG